MLCGILSWILDQGRKHALKDFIGPPGKHEHGFYIRYQYCINSEFSELGNFIVVLKMNISVLRSFGLKN